jgi:hypothetical protein
MAVTLVTTTMAAGVNYTVTTDTSADWPSVANSTYFYDKADKLVHYKDSTGTVLEIFSSGGGGGTPAGSNGEIQFNNSGAFGADSLLVWDNTNKRLGVGATPDTTVRLDVRAQGALSTDIAFRVRNSADTQNIISAQGDGKTTFSNSMLEIENNDVTGIGYTRLRKITEGFFNKGSELSLFKNDATNNIEIVRIQALSEGGIFVFPENQGTKSIQVGGSLTVGNGGAVSIYKTGSLDHHIQIRNQFHNIFHVTGTGAQATLRIGNAGTNVNFFNVHGNSGGSLTTNPIFTINSNGNFANGVTSFGTSAQFVFAQGNGTAPTTSPADAYQQYSADIVAGNAAPHFRTENGNIIKIYQETTAITAATFVANTSAIVDDTATYGGYTMGQVVAALKAQGLLA